MESPNPDLTGQITDGKRDGAKEDIQWHEEELRRDPAKTMTSTDAGKGKTDEKSKSG
jgi:hypothetical protein